ncbi:phage virion morphogenesis protein [Spongiibacter taiwanensis]|uniref:phage virion morphogenesis protein n=1 Tax=Spongiibacter taiwanensis TaxID=1748242 RepID=UPI002035D3EC|nr:phage virion morphogenesis protein [Spongiibacter taiwanensis]USA43330.1 phage virion morphogenesis protein [Spongiibacter taiwanensis]
MATEYTDSTLNDWLSATLAPLSPASRRQLMRDIALYLRQSQSQRVAAQKNPDGTAFEPRKSRLQKPGIRRRAMFARIRTRKHLRYRASADEAAVGFRGRVAAIAEVHQHGLIAEVEQGGPLVKYAQRELLGLSDADMSHIDTLVSKHLSGR